MNDDLARLVAQQRRAFSTISSPGYLDGGVLGVALDFQPEGWIFLEVLESPGTASFTGYSWEQRVPRPDGSWAAPDATLGIVLSGNNGGTGATRRNPAFVLGGGGVTVGATAYAVRGYQDGAETSGGTGQEWLILGLVSGCSGTCATPTDGYTYAAPATGVCSLDIYAAECLPDTNPLQILNRHTRVCFTTPLTVTEGTAIVLAPPCPAGPTGATGPATTLTIGSVTSLPSGTPSTADFSGSVPPDYVLNLGLEAGADGTTPSGAALTKTDDTNVTLSLGGSPSTALVNAASITVGWSGTLAVSRGGTHIGSYSVGDILYASGTTTLAALNAGTDGKVLTLASGVPSWATATIAGAALTKTDDTNVTLSLGGSPTTALAHAASITVGWTGTLGVARGGTNIGSYTAGDILYATGATTLAKLGAGADGKVLTVVSGAPAWADSSATVSGAALTKTDDTNVTLTLGGSPSTALVNAASITVGWSGQLAISRGGTNASTAAAAFNNLSPMSAFGDMIYGGSSGAGSRLAGNTSTAYGILIGQGDGTHAGIPQWLTLDDILDGVLGWADGDIIKRVSGHATKVTPITKNVCTALGTGAFTGTISGCAITGTTTFPDAVFESVKVIP